MVINAEYEMALIETKIWRVFRKLAMKRIEIRGNDFTDVPDKKIKVSVEYINVTKLDNYNLENHNCNCYKINFKVFSSLYL